MSTLTDGEIYFKMLLIEAGIESENQKTIRFKSEHYVDDYTKPLLSKTLKFKHYPDQKVFYFEQKTKRFIKPDFYLPSYNGYCEVITSPDTIYGGKLQKLNWIIQEGYKFTFYTEKGSKIMFTKRMLNKFGVKNNSDFFIIKEFPYREVGVHGCDFWQN